MKLNYRDSMILIGILTFIIALLGIFLVIKPKVTDIKADNVKLEEIKAEWQGIEKKLNEIQPLKDQINQIYKDSKTLSDDFVDVSLISSPQALDKFMQPYADECNMEVKVLDVGLTATTELKYYYFKPNVLTSSMFDAADINGEFQKSVDSALTESNSLSERKAETVMKTQYGIMARGTREDIWAFMEKINSLDTTILIDSVNISDYTFGENTKNVEGVQPDDRSDVTFVISLYSVFEMDEPVVE